jgi:hypothetical protein
MFTQAGVTVSHSHAIEEAAGPEGDAQTQ